ncbi:ribonuclease P Rpr2/Rpp21/SNM1 subunit family protein [Halorhabdus amylolytica]|uniref:hypothetical protein n=1 Tax=Halorhabdus amylolytica TaxID=2559573 RepID=UPI0010AA8B11|nr:hypothetical protein [Halorhabdus amylolytica]
MPAKTGASHAVAAFVSILLGGLISDLLGTYATAFTDLGRVIGRPVASTIGLAIPATTTGHLLIATVLAFGWGVAYHYARHGDDDGETENVGALSKNSGVDHPSNPDDSDGSEALAGVVTVDYTPDSARTADAEVGSYLESTLRDDVRPKLAATHDLLVDRERRELAERVSSLASDIETIERAISPSLETTMPDPGRRNGLKDSHSDLLETVTALRASTSILESALREGQPDVAIKECRSRYEELREANERRRRLIEQASETL